MACYCRCGVLLRIALVGFFASAGAGESVGALVGKTQLVALIDMRNLSLDPRFINLYSPYLNDRGEVIFYGFLFQTGSNSPRIYRSSGQTPDEVEVVGMQTSNGTRTITRFLQTVNSGSGSSPPIGAIPNSEGSIAFGALSTGMDESDPSQRGIYRLDDELVELARVGEQLPDGNGTFASFSNYVLNDSGQIAYLGQITTNHW